MISGSFGRESITLLENQFIFLQSLGKVKKSTKTLQCVALLRTRQEAQAHITLCTRMSKITWWNFFTYIFTGATRALRLDTDSQRSFRISLLKSPRHAGPVITSQWNHRDSDTSNKEHPLSKTCKTGRVIKIEMKPIDDMTLHLRIFDGHINMGVPHRAKHAERTYIGILPVPHLNQKRRTLSYIILQRQSRAGLGGAFERMSHRILSSSKVSRPELLLQALTF